MSEESAKDVSPLRLKRPGAPVPPTGGGFPPVTPAPSDISSPAPSPLPEVPAPLPPPPAIEPAGSSPVAPVPPARRRPTLAPDAVSTAPLLPDGSPITGGTLIGGLPDKGAAPEAAPAPIKLRIGPKPPPPPPMPLPAMTDDPFAGSEGMPLVPLPGLPAMPSLAPLPPLPGQAQPPPSRPQGTAQIGAGAPGSMPPGFKVGSPDTPLMPLSLAGSTRAPFGAGGANPPPLPARGKKKIKAHSARRDLMIFLVIFLLLAAGGVGAYFYLTKPEESADVIAGVKDRIEKAAEMPGKAVDSAKESMAHARSAEQDRVDKLMSGQDASEKRGLPGAGVDLEAKLKAANGAVGDASAQPAANEPTEKPVTDRPANQVSAVVTDVSGQTDSKTGNTVEKAANAPGSSAPSPRFVRYAEGLNVSGVFQGSPARALVDGRIVRSGDLLEPVQGIKFVGVDAATKHLILQDASGAQLRVKY